MSFLAFLLHIFALAAFLIYIKEKLSLCIPYDLIRRALHGVDLLELSFELEPLSYLLPAFLLLLDLLTHSLSDILQPLLVLHLLLPVLRVRLLVLRRTL